ncbi:MAG: hypothetical protein LQ352_005725 [Teloschistes flavicans]|nr:MAG: hypothetical protein LQ352_005725 [Teloschistes flavicans]
MGVFWNSWQLWEKLCFVMGAAIVVVLFAGMIKLAHTHWKLRKYTALAKTKAAQKEEDLQRQPSAVRRKKNGNDIPFGIRAIESGIEVDGVWISRSNTPANSTPGSPSLLANKDPVVQHPAPADRSSTVSDMSRLEIPQPAHGGRPRQNPSRSSNSSYTRSSGGNPFERSRSSEASSSRPNSTYIDSAPRGRATYQPRRASGLRYSNSHAGDNADALAHLEGRRLSSKTGSKSSNGSTEYEHFDQRASDDSWSGSSGENARHGHHQPVAAQGANPRYNRSDLDSLASHRKSHAAETGQLIPRVRVKDAAGEWTSVQQPAEHRNFLSDRSASPMGSSSDPFSTPHTTPVMTPMKEPSRGPPSFEEFVRSTSPQGQYYLGEEGIPLQEQMQHSHDHSDYGSSAMHQQRGKQDTIGGKASSFSEAV